MNLLLILLTLGWAPTPALAENISQVTVEFSTSTAPLVLNYFAAKYSIDFNTFLAVSKCESGLNKNAVGDQGKSFGIFQIHLPAHPAISKEQALDPWWAANWSAQQFAAGRANMWTCYRLLQSK